MTDWLEREVRLHKGLDSGSPSGLLECQIQDTESRDWSHGVQRETKEDSMIRSEVRPHFRAGAGSVAEGTGVTLGVILQAQ